MGGKELQIKTVAVRTGYRIRAALCSYMIKNFKRDSRPLNQVWVPVNLTVHITMTLALFMLQVLAEQDRLGVIFLSTL